MDVLAPVAVLAEPLVEKCATGFGLVLHVELFFFPYFIIVVGEGALL